jgi:hypothetical protein
VASNTKKSPLTGHDVSVQGDPCRDIDYYNDICGRWGITFEARWGEATIIGGRLRTAQGLLTDQKTRQVLALARSQVWRLNNVHNKTPLFLTLATAKPLSDDFDASTPILTIEDVAKTASQLTLQKKALTTLENLSVEEQEIGAGVDIPYLFFEYPGSPTWKPGQPPKESGISYGCTDIEAPMVYQLLMKRGLAEVRQPKSKTDNSRVFLTPDGYSKIDELRAGSQLLFQQAFLVCRFTPEMDEMYTSTYEPTGNALKCPIQRIKDVHHVDKIDDRICEEIRRATVVVVDLTDQNFNVAFEAGFALALNKPIVWTKRKEAGGVKMPFDIYTHNCLEWDPTNLEQFREDLKFRLIAALQKSPRSREF